MSERGAAARAGSARLTAVTAAVVLLVLVVRFWPSVTLLDRMELRTLDWRFLHRGARPPHPELVIVHVDEESIRKLGRWPWPRQPFATLIDALTAAGARAIVFDIFFADPDTTPGGAQSDAQLVAATQRSGIVFHAAFGHGPKQRPDEAMVQAIAGHGWPQARIAGGAGAAALAGLYELSEVTSPLPELLDAAAGIGFVNVVDSGDGVFRHTFPVALLGQTPFPSLALAVCARLLQVTPDQVVITPGHSVRLGSVRTIPIDRVGRMLIDFAGGDHTYPYVSVAQVLQSMHDPGALRDRFGHKIVLVAVSAPGLYDLRANPFSTVYNGVETQANIIANILEGRFLRALKGEHSALIIVLAGVAALIGLPRLRPVPALAYALGLLVAYNWLCVRAFVWWGVVLDMAAPNLVLLLSILAMLGSRLVRERSETERVREVLGRFVPPAIVERVVASEPETLLTGQRRVLSVMFVDLRGFTARSEKMPPEQAVELLNRFFLFAQEVIYEFEGTLDKYLGDGLMAFFNAPLDQPDHALRAVQTAVVLQRRIRLNAAEWEFLGAPDLAAGVGISTGEAVVGYIGTGDRMQYTAIGADVNLAARLEALNKELGTSILISQSTYELVAAAVVAEPRGPVVVRGFSDPIQVYEVKDLR